MMLRVGVLPVHWAFSGNYDLEVIMSKLNATRTALFAAMGLEDRLAEFDLIEMDVAAVLAHPSAPRVVAERILASANPLQMGEECERLLPKKFVFELFRELKMIEDEVKAAKMNADNGSANNGGNSAEEPEMKTDEKTDEKKAEESGLDDFDRGYIAQVEAALAKDRELFRSERKRIREELSGEEASQTLEALEKEHKELYETRMQGLEQVRDRATLYQAALWRMSDFARWLGEWFMDMWDFVSHYVTVAAKATWEQTKIAAEPHLHWEVWAVNAALSASFGLTAAAAAAMTGGGALAVGGVAAGLTLGSLMVTESFVYSGVVNGWFGSDEAAPAKA